MLRSVGLGGLAVPQVREQLVEVGGVQLAGAGAAPSVIRLHLSFITAPKVIDKLSCCS